MKYNKNNKRKFKDYLEYSFYSIDHGCSHIFWCGDFLFFDADEWGNGRGPILKFKLLKNRIKLSSGDLLTSKEKKLTFNLKDYENFEQLSEDISSFTRKYFKSITIKLVRV